MSTRRAARVCFFANVTSFSTCGRLAFARTEPGKTNRHATANRLLRRKPAFAAHEQQRRLAIFLKMRDVRAVPVNFRRGGFGGDNDFWQSAIPAGNGDPAGDFTFSQRV